MRRALGLEVAGGAINLGGVGRKGMTLTSRAHMSGREKRQGTKEKYTIPKGKCIRKMGQRGGAWADQARFQERISNSNDFEIPNGFWNLAGLWEFAQGDLGGILMHGFVENSSRNLKGFRKKYNMSYHEMHPMQDYF
jgi:hypothetical protein